MIYMKCPACGGRCEFEYGKGYACDCCGNIYNGDENSDSITDKLNFANAKRIEDYDFEGASRLCAEVLSESPDNQEANWCALLAEYQIIYLQNDEGEYVPTFLNPDVETPLNKSKYYDKLNGNYRKMADKIEQMRKLVVMEAKDIPDYDVFISYRQHVGRGSNVETEESAWADEIYKLLSKQTGDDKLRIFYDKASLDSSNAGWEPHIYAALRSAKFLILMGSSVENMNSTWVKNEWKRFISYRQMGKEKTIAVLAKNVDPMKLPDIALRAGQMIKADEKGWQEKLVKRANDACKENKDVPYLLNEAETFIQKKNFKKAKQNYLKVCSLEPRNSKAYWGLLKCKLKAMDDYDLIKSRKKFVKINEYNDAVRYAVGREKEHYMEICNAQLTHNTNGYERTNYNIWKEKSKVQRAFKKVAIVVAVLVLCAFGGYSYFGITQPVNYKVENGKATLSGKSIYFNVMVDDLKVDTYKNYPVVKIGDGVFKNSNIKSIELSESVKEIGDSAFENCQNLTSITIENCDYIGDNAFRGCTNLTQLKIGISDDTQIGVDAFANVGRNVTICVPTVSEIATAQLQEAYPNITFTTYTQDAVKECIYFIAKLSTVSYDSEDDIQKAENLYNALSVDEKSKVKNYGVLQNARISYNTVTAINAIGTVTLDSERKIIEAENLYDTLTAEQKSAVGNYTDLTTARVVYNTMAQIAEIGEVSINSEPKIIKAEEAYLALTYEQRDMVANYSVLTAARTKVDTLLVNEVSAKITAIGTITIDSEAKIAEAEAAYNSLTEAQKNRVTNYDTLTDARAIYNVVNSINNIGTITAKSGNTITVAQTLYDNLTSAQKLKVLNYSELTDATAVYPVVSQIGAIGNVVIASISAIEKAEADYASLSAIQQTKVSNYDTLTDSRRVYATVVLIDEIGTISKENFGKIETAQNSYDSLTPAQQGIVGNYVTLSNAVKVYEVIVAIDGIGDVSLSSSSKIASVESSYNALTSAQQQLVSNYKTLRTARAIYNLETVINSLGTLVLGSGSNYSYKTLTANNMVSELNNAATRNQINSVTRTGFNLFSASENSAFFEAFPNFDIVRYDLSQSQTSGQTYRITSGCTRIGLIGNHTYTYANSQIKFDSRYSDVSLELWNFNISGSSVIDATQVPSQYTVTLNFVGTCSIRGVNGGNGTVGADGTSSLDINVISGKAGSSGSRGQNAISANTLKINVDANATVKMYGGAGGVGGNGGNGSSCRVSNDGYAQCGHGGVGGAGGNGGDAISAYSVTIANYGTLELYGGAGGAGGVGGNGGNNSDTGTDKPDHGGNGGNGGVGGTGGCAINSNFISVTGSTIKTVGGNGAVGGNGGNGGNGHANTYYPNGTRGGDAGNGGKGGDGGASVSVNCSNATKSAGQGALGGTAGTIGTNPKKSDKNGQPGTNGAKGSNGIR